uniref:Protein SPT2 homolog n=1 Tax=Anopheles atroparvus TaxID=41427 RepID=A0AAG5DV70_ANOAO
MDFGKLLSVAKRNTSVEGHNGEGRYYSTKFAPPKKESKEKKLSENIKKFLAKKEEEERAKALEARRKAEELMAKRDVKAKKKIEKMLKVIKSANKSVLDDATDAQSNLIALAGPEQPDEDDYGYTSNVASQFYQQLMDKYKSNPEEQRFKEAERRTMSKEDLARTKARVKDAIVRQAEEENGPRSRKSRVAGGAPTGGGSEERDSGGRCARGPDPYDPAEEQRRREADAARAKTEEKRKQLARKGASGAPPPPDFATLLKLAEQKQKEPIRLEADRAPEKRRTEPERLMTKREKKEHDERMAFFEMKRLRDRIKDDPKLSDKEKQQRLAKLEAMRAAGKLPGIPAANGDGGARAVAPSPAAASPTKLALTANSVPSNARPSLGASGAPNRSITGSSGSPSVICKQTELGRIKKRSEPNGTDPLAKKSASGDSRGAPTATTALSSSQNSRGKQQHNSASASRASTSSSTNERHPITSPSSAANSKSPVKPISKDALSNGQVQRGKGEASSGHTSSKPSSSASSGTAPAGARPSAHPRLDATPGRSSLSSSSLAGAPKRDAQDSVRNGTRQPVAAARPAVSSGSKRPPTEIVTQTRQFPPPDVQRTVKRPATSQQNGRQQRPAAHSAAAKKRRVIDSDSEYDSEMDDFIDDGDCEEDYSSAIKEIFGYDKSRYRDEHYEEDDYNMESSYAQQMREEYISKKIGIMEDLEDMRMEEEEKRRKMGKKGGTTAAKKK